MTRDLLGFTSQWKEQEVNVFAHILSRTFLSFAELYEKANESFTI